MEHIKRLSKKIDTEDREKDVRGKKLIIGCGTHCESGAPPDSTCVRGGDSC